MSTRKLTLPWPPSANRYWRHPTTGRLAGRHLLSAEGRAYRETVAGIVRARRFGEPLVGRLWMDVLAYPPDKRRRDLDNILKAVQDALQHAGVYRDDSQIDALQVTRCKAGDGVVAVSVGVRA